MVAKRPECHLQQEARLSYANPPIHEKPCSRTPRIWNISLIYICTCMNMCLCTCTQRYIYISCYIYTSTYICIHMYMHPYECESNRMAQAPNWEWCLFRVRCNWLSQWCAESGVWRRKSLVLFLDTMLQTPLHLVRAQNGRNSVGCYNLLLQTLVECYKLPVSWALHPLHSC